MIYLHYKDTKTFGHSFSFLLIFKTLRASYLQVGNFSNEPTLKSKACLKCLYFTIIIFDLCRYLEYFSYLCTINQTE